MTDRTYRNLGRTADGFSAVAVAGALAGVVALAWAIMAATPSPCDNPYLLAHNVNGSLVYCDEVTR